MMLYLYLYLYLCVCVCVCDFGIDGIYLATTIHTVTKCKIQIYLPTALHNSFMKIANHGNAVDGVAVVVTPQNKLSQN